MKKLKFIYIYITFLFFDLSFSQSVYVPLSHPVYDFLNRAETKNYTGKFLSGTKPYSRKECATALVKISKYFNELTDYEKEVMRFLLSEFKEEFGKDDFRNISSLLDGVKKIQKPKFFPRNIYKNNRNFFKIESENISIYADPIFNSDYRYINTDTIDGKKNINRLTGGFKIRGKFGDNVAFYGDYRNTREWGLNYPIVAKYSLEGLGYVSGYGTHIYHNESIAYMIFDLSLLEIEVGRNVNRWGPGLHGSLTLSDFATSYDLIKFKTKFWRLKFCSLTGFLRSYPEITYENTVYENGKEFTREMNSKKYIAAHRLELSVTDRFDIAINEVVIYGDRGLEIAYLNPIMFYRSSEHYLGDMDNATMSLDFNWVPFNRYKIYGEFFLDDIRVKKIGTKWYGNKFAYLGGIFITDPFKLKDTETFFEYARIKPFVYTHHYPINVYKHFSTPLGYFAGPNTEDYFFLFRKYFSRRSKVSFEFEILKHGTNYPEKNIGGDINRPYLPGDPRYVEFLEGIVEKQIRCGLFFQYDFYRHYYMKFIFNYNWLKNIEINKARGSTESINFKIGFGINYL